MWVYDELASFPRCIPTSCPAFLGQAPDPQEIKRLLKLNECMSSLSKYEICSCLKSTGSIAVKTENICLSSLASLLYRTRAGQSSEELYISESDKSGSIQPKIYTSESNSCSGFQHYCSKSNLHNLTRKRYLQSFRANFHFLPISYWNLSESN